MNTKSQILDIAMNLNRLGNWAADNYEAKKERIKIFLGNTTQDVQNISESSFPPSFARTFIDFKNHYSKLERAGYEGPKDTLSWAESMMTWGNILTHRASLFDKNEQ